MFNAVSICAGVKPLLASAVTSANCNELALTLLRKGLINVFNAGSVELTAVAAPASTAPAAIPVPVPAG